MSAPTDDTERAGFYGRRVAAWEDRTEQPLALLALVFLGVYAWPILDTHIPPTAERACHIANLTIWAIFAIDYVTRVAITRHRAHYWAHNLPDFAMVVLPVLRPLRLLRLLILLKVLNRRTASNMRGQVGIYVTGSATILLLCSSLAILSAERGAPGAMITTFWDALWWSFVTVSTVGYGDITPVTGEGRLIGVGLMLGGVALLGVVTATLASWLVDRVREVNEVEQDVTKADIARLREELAELREIIVQRELPELRELISNQDARRPPQSDPYTAQAAEPE